MIPMEPGPEVTRATSPNAPARGGAGGRLAHSRTGLMVRYLRRLADRIDPTGAARRAGKTRTRLRECKA
jgi:hypothetical protein